MKWGTGWEVGYNREIDLQAHARMLAEETKRQEQRRFANNTDLKP